MVKHFLKEGIQTFLEWFYKWLEMVKRFKEVFNVYERTKIAQQNILELKTSCPRDHITSQSELCAGKNISSGALTFCGVDIIIPFNQKHPESSIFLLFDLALQNLDSSLTEFLENIKSRHGDGSETI